MHFVDGLHVKGAKIAIQMIHMKNGESIVENQVLIGSSPPDIQTGGCFLAAHNTRQ